MLPQRGSQPAVSHTTLTDHTSRLRSRRGRRSLPQSCRRRQVGLASRYLCPELQNLVYIHSICLAFAVTVRAPDLTSGLGQLGARGTLRRRGAALVAATGNEPPAATLSPLRNGGADGGSGGAGAVQQQPWGLPRRALWPPQTAAGSVPKQRQPATVKLQTQLPDDRKLLLSMFGESALGDPLTAWSGKACFLPLKMCCLTSGLPGLTLIGTKRDQ